MRCLPFCVLAVLLFVSPGTGAEITLEEEDGGVAVLIDGELFTRYVTQSGAKPILWPIIGPTGEELTRAYPMREAEPGERSDHVHHRSFWFTHGDVNGISFWHEREGDGTIVHREYLRKEIEPAAVIATRNDWVGPDGNRVCQDERTFLFGADEASRWIDVTIIVTATDGDVTFGDTKEGSFGVRIAGTMKVDSEPGGHIINSEGQNDADAWGQPAAWVDCYGPVADATVGIAIMNHPESFRFPTRWHVRNYGLFTANPFGRRSFDRSESDGSYVLDAGETLTLRYRVLFHRGDAQQAEIAKRYAEYSLE